MRADAMAFPLEGYDFIWASPPCQRYTILLSGRPAIAAQHPDLLDETRKRLVASGIPYVLENVPGAPMRHPLAILCGTMFGLGSNDAQLWRHRIFEFNFPLGLVPQCQHNGSSAVGCYGGGPKAKSRRRSVITVTGHSGGNRRRGDLRQSSMGERREAMGIYWMNRDEINEAIPPAYAEFIGKQAMEVLMAQRRVPPGVG